MTSPAERTGRRPETMAASPGAEAAPDDAADSAPARAAGWEWYLTLALLAFGGLDCLAFAAVWMPHELMNAIHHRCGLGDLPRVPIVGYLARTTSLLYMLHGATILFLLTDVRRYWPLIRFLAFAAVVHGAILAAIDSIEGLPLWWRITEGSCISLTGLTVLFLQWRSERAAD